MNSTTPIPTVVPNLYPFPSAAAAATAFSQSLNPTQHRINRPSKSVKRVLNSSFVIKPSAAAAARSPCRAHQQQQQLASCLPPSPVAEKVKRVVSEFKSLPEPIDRVKRLLHYAASLPPCSESAREPESRVPGCATQVWVEAELDEAGRVRFRADSDSEISKGFCSCLIWMLDGAEPAEVLEIRAKDLEAVNVGIYVGKANSRVNTWHNVLLAMQRKTRDLVTNRVAAG